MYTKSLITPSNTHLEIGSKYIKQYDSIQAYLSNDGDDLGYFDEMIQLVANQTTFTALSKKGKVYTWGDGRYESCLGRECSDEMLNPTKPPCISTKQN